MSGKERGAAAPRGPRARSFVGRIRDGEAILRRRRRIRGGEAPQFGLLTEALLAKHPAFVVIDSHGLGKSGAVHAGIDKRCEAEGCHVIENADLSSLSEERRLHLRIEVELDHPSTGKPCRIWRMQTAGGREERSGL